MKLVQYQKTLQKKSADSALFEEKNLTDESIEGNSASSIDISIDAAWQKRGSQRSYNSLSGFTSTRGKRSKSYILLHELRNVELVTKQHNKRNHL